MGYLMDKVKHNKNTTFKRTERPLQPLSVKRTRLKKVVRLSKLVDEGTSILPTINKMTAWQRNQWARAGYPGDQVAKFAKLKYGVHPKKQRKRLSKAQVTLGKVDVLLGDQHIGTAQ